jgi:hypothetical protein
MATTLYSRLSKLDPNFNVNALGNVQGSAGYLQRLNAGIMDSRNMQANKAGAGTGTGVLGDELLSDSGYDLERTIELLKEKLPQPSVGDLTVPAIDKTGIRKAAAKKAAPYLSEQRDALGDIIRESRRLDNPDAAAAYVQRASKGMGSNIAKIAGEAEDVATKENMQDYVYTKYNPAVASYNAKNTAATQAYTNLMSVLAKYM